MYLYDLAVLLKYRRQGIATALIERLELIATQRGVYEIFVQANTAIEDQPAIALYSKLGAREQFLHFSIPVE
ncbi:MAG: GNAT family N-acetyltransferase [Granulosicoccaceae bacterium]